nr:Armadillo type fold [Hymenolepis microstoma]
MDSNSQLQAELDRIFSQSPKSNLSSAETKRHFTVLRNLSTTMTYTVICDPDVVRITASDNCVNYFKSAVDFIVEELPHLFSIHFEEPLVYNFKALYVALWNFTDKICDLCNRFVLADAHRSIWKLLCSSEMSSSFSFYKDSILLVLCSLGILHNLLRYCPQARDDYRNCGGIKILEPYVADASASKECADLLISLKTAALFTLAAIVNENEDVSAITTDQDVLTHILSALNDSLQSPPDYYSAKYGYHAAEVFVCLGYLAGVDSNKKSLVANNCLGYISTALQISLRVKNGFIKVASKSDTTSRHSYRFSEDTLAKEAIDLLWCLSCLPEAREQLKETSDLFKLCAQFNDTRYTAECRKSVQALFCILSQHINFLDESGKLNISAITTSPKPRGHVMISYNHTAQHLVSKLKQALVLRGWKVWIFTEHCRHGSFLEHMAEAVFDSAAMVICLSSFYNASCHCVKEVVSAYENRIPLLPVILEADYVPINFIKFITTGAKSIKLYTDSQVDYAADKITEQLRRYGVMRVGTNLNQIQPPPSLSISSAKRHQRSHSDCLGGVSVKCPPPRSNQASISTEASAALTPLAGSPAKGFHCSSRQLKARPPPNLEHLVIGSSAVSPRSQRCDGAPGSAYFFNSTLQIDTASCSSAVTGVMGSSIIQLPSALESYLVEQVPSKAVRLWQEEQVRAWLTEYSLEQYAHAFAHITGVQLYELAWQRIRGCDSFFRNLAFTLQMPLYEQLLLSSALASLHNHPDPSSPSASSPPS